MRTLRPMLTVDKLIVFKLADSDGFLTKRSQCCILLVELASERLQVPQQPQLCSSYVVRQ